MVRPNTKTSKPGHSEKPFRFTRRLKEIDRFFEGRDGVHRTMRRTTQRLEEAGIPYAIYGAMAVNAHGYRHTTDDVDFLLNAEGLDEFRRRFVPKHYAPLGGRTWRFLDGTDEVRVDVLVTGRSPRNEPAPITFPDPALVGVIVHGLRVLDLLPLIQLKLTAGRHRDLADVAGLIRFNNLDESFADRLHPSVRQDYNECLEENRREKEYEERNG